MLFAGSGKAFGFAPPDIQSKLAAFGLGDRVQLIGWGEMLAAVLVLLPWTSPLGVLLTSGFWGGVICIHMAHGEPYLFQALMLVLSWAGAYLRNPATLSSFSGPPRMTRKAAAASAPAWP